jgi:enamine deaminase RidA (YjgF/YER057c/UK114 family)
MRQALLPDGWARPKGYANGIKASGTMVFTAGVIGWNEREEFESDLFLDQLRQALVNTKAILAAGDASPGDIVRMTWYVTDMQAYAGNLKEIGEIWRDIFGKVFPCMACVQVVSLVEERAKIEIETTAVIPEVGRR